MLLATAGLATALVVAWRVALAAHDDLATLTTRVAAHERELADVRRAAAVLARAPAPAAADAPPLLARLETAAVAAVGRERVASLTPVAAEDASAEERVALRLAGASLAQTVALLHALEAATPPLAVTHLELRKLPDDAGRFDATMEISAPRAAP
jgi:hypothetical protein